MLKKGIDVAVRAMALLDADARLVIAGRGPETPTLVRLARELGLGDRVSFAGPIAHDALPWLLAMADLVLVPSRSVYDPRRFAVDHETMGRIVCEAAACGTPVVASRCGGIPEVVRDGHTGLLVEPGSPDDLAGAVRSILDDTVRRDAMGLASRRWAAEALSFDRVNVATLDRLMPGRDDAAMNATRFDYAAAPRDRAIGSVTEREYQPGIDAE